MNIPLLSDFQKKISKDYGVLLDEEGVALRGLFLIDPEGIVRHMSVNDLPVGRSVDETLRLVKAFQFVAEHGEVCPVFLNSPLVRLQFYSTECQQTILSAFKTKAENKFTSAHRNYNLTRTCITCAQKINKN